ncbi:sugar transferase [Candidatus Falkowbacteria bacterium CG11_big_fil_rev_8_21_14_0_20_39_10]|uniref:Sugar transferase n=1 Tax=Candidatus Falkowbacteria bacterium CG11_big_fil_rev_8_21_14_0_20_39_10 TaxID=1974570 RepID=A0A2M6K9H4_9BACT|nr:MAG: sugar transferase [Candidatus Falkowbacteria bacterium CG11_big_fil_rev_8_21_14_0_20_39_10]
MNNNLKKFSLLIGDVAMLYLALYFTLLIRYSAQINQELWQGHFAPFSLVFVVWILIFYISDLYNLSLAVSNSRFFQLTGRSLAIAALLSIAFFYLNPNINIAPKTNMLIFVVVFAVLFFLWRQFFNWSLKSYLPKNNIAIIGFNNQAMELISELKQKPHLGYRVSFVISRDFDQNNIDHIPVFSKISDLKNLIKAKAINTVIIASDPHKSDELRNILFGCLELKVNYINLPNFYEDITGKIPIEVINQMWFLENLSRGSRSGFDFIKRIYDIVLALAVFIITLPFWPIIALIIKMESSGPAFFISRRAGKNYKNFKLIKFRTMREEGNDRSLTKVDDNRVTKFGKLMRTTRIDEVPQMINVIKGEMSFVGPRPERPELIEELQKQIPFYNERTLVKPGVTGWDQISGEYHSPTREDTLKKLQYDLFYIKNRSIYLDLSIILKTIATILSQGGR